MTELAGNNYAVQQSHKSQPNKYEIHRKPNINLRFQTRAGDRFSISYLGMADRFVTRNILDRIPRDSKVSYTFTCCPNLRLYLFVNAYDKQLDNKYIRTANEC